MAVTSLAFCITGFCNSIAQAVGWGTRNRLLKQMVWLQFSVYVSCVGSLLGNYQQWYQVWSHAGWLNAVTVFEREDLKRNLPGTPSILEATCYKQFSPLLMAKQPLASFHDLALMCTGPLYIMYIEYICIRLPYSGDRCLAYSVPRYLKIE